jgi:hypothetical protein
VQEAERRLDARRRRARAVTLLLARRWRAR